MKGKKGLSDNSPPPPPTPQSEGTQRTDTDDAISPPPPLNPPNPTLAQNKVNFLLRYSCSACLSNDTTS
jgi:hypothetical protein